MRQTHKYPPNWGASHSSASLVPTFKRAKDTPRWIINISYMVISCSITGSFRLQPTIAAAVPDNQDNEDNEIPDLLSDHDHDDSQRISVLKSKL
ncbi:hypothetical protein C8J57DRAFT_1491845 [Mycena rebaudengoi]|nr:hypothetical protein C8J57DRAFT_1491845 [Mycena rebaudengoi]